MLLAKSDGAADPKKIRIVEAEYRAEKGFSRTSAGFANSIFHAMTPSCFPRGSRTADKQRSRLFSGRHEPERVLPATG